MAMDQKFINKKKFQKIFYLFKKYLFPRCFVAAAVAFRGTQSNQKCIKREVQWFFHTALCRFQNVLLVSVKFFPSLARAGLVEELRHLYVVVILWSGACARSKIFR